MVRIHPCPFSHAEVAQLVEQHLDMVEVVGSSPIPRIENNTFAPRFNPRGAFSFKGGGLGRGVHAVIKSACTFSVYTRQAVGVHARRQKTTNNSLLPVPSLFYYPRFSLV